MKLSSTEGVFFERNSVSTMHSLLGLMTKCHPWPNTVYCALAYEQHTKAWAIVSIRVEDPYPRCSEEEEKAKPELGSKERRGT